MKRKAKVTIFVTTATAFALGAGTSAFGTSPAPDGSCTAADVGKTFSYTSPTGLKHDVLTCKPASSGHRWVITSSTTTRAPSSTKASTGQSSSASGSSASSPYGSATNPTGPSSLPTKPAKYVPVQKTPSYQISEDPPIPTWYKSQCTRSRHPTSAVVQGPWYCFLAN